MAFHRELVSLEFRLTYAFDRHLCDAPTQVDQQGRAAAAGEDREVVAVAPALVGPRRQNGAEEGQHVGNECTGDDGSGQSGKKAPEERRQSDVRLIA